LAAVWQPATSAIKGRARLSFRVLDIRFFSVSVFR